ncbi:hypothetical protein RCO28_34630 [Streptomyces sp. LHD-70]|uniref:DUF6166 domain-containing protein n=1 Tax=Streptomyces sp. LHD-70 TaxID=3072140 RepID=UPI00280DAF6E|nr:DUF6166 domain-containing protein [Streptomyces sp. LHD-70]MDQ8707570.1 hypothetical protein [Streptomyces sp. LHD-70]
MAYEDCTYHGIQYGPETDRGDDEEWKPARILVEEPEFGPTQRQMGVTVLRELAEPEASGFGWGYNGGGTSAAAAAILADALDLGDPDKAGIGYTAYLEDEVLVQLREDFCDDVLSQLCDQWRLRRSIILRWSLAWYLQRGIDEVPTALRELPPLQSQT